MASDEEFSPNEIVSMRDDLDFAHAIMRHAVQHNVSGFSFTGLRVPPVLQSWGNDLENTKAEGFAAELVNFEEQIYDRIVSLANNKRMLREIWAFNERSRAFRESELSVAKSSKRVIAELVDLVNALFVQDAALIIQILEASRLRRLAVLAGHSGIVLPFPETRHRR